MGFLFKKIFGKYHGTGSESGPVGLNPSVAISSSTAMTPVLNIARLLSPSVAISSSTARTPALTSEGVVNPSTGQYIMGTNGALPIYFDYAAKHASDTVWRNNYIHNSLPTYSNPSKAGGVGGNNKLDASKNLHGDGRFPDLVELVSTPDPTFGPNFAEPVFEFTLPGINAAGETPTAELSGVMQDGVNYYECILLRRRAFCSTPKFTTIGDATGAGATYNLSQGKGFKIGSYTSFYSGRSGLEGSNGRLDGGGNPIMDYDFVDLPGPDVNTGTGLNINVLASGSELYDGNLYVEAVHVEQWNRTSDNTNWTAVTYYRRPDGSSTWAQIGQRAVAPLNVLIRQFEYTHTGLNYNQSRLTSLKWWLTHSATFIPTLGGLNVDPAGFLAQIAALTPENPTGLVINSATSNTINLTVTRGRFTGYLRVEIDSSFIVGQDYTVLREEGELQVVGYSTKTTGTSTFSITSLGLSAGSHTVKVFAVNKNGTVLSASGPSTTINV